MTKDPIECVYPNVRPKDASTLILLDRSGPTPKILVGRRHAGHEFMPSKFVFPGGRVEIGDRRVPVAGELDPQVETRLMRRTEQPSRAKARGFAVAAIREAFEETGLLIGKRLGADARKLPNGPWRAFADAGIQPDLSEMRFIARAVTPPRRLRRFDTRFFVLDAGAIAHRIEGFVGPDAELVELIWLPITDAQKLDILPITRIVLAGLESWIASDLRHDLPVPYYRTLRRRFTRELL
jgi:8-oxo-dGTP pyrophosphatase MutT (NUDIX family)